MKKIQFTRAVYAAATRRGCRMHTVTYRNERTAIFTLLLIEIYQISI